jgi:hypothetical protein
MWKKDNTNPLVPMFLAQFDPFESD